MAYHLLNYSIMLYVGFLKYDISSKVSSVNSDKNVLIIALMDMTIHINKEDEWHYPAWKTERRTLKRSAVDHVFNIIMNKSGEKTYDLYVKSAHSIMINTFSVTF